MDEPNTRLCRSLRLAGAEHNTVESSPSIVRTSSLPVKDTTFNDLPLEIRLRIWDLSLPRHRLVYVGYGGEGPRALRPFSVKPITVNKESYNATFKACAELRGKTFFDKLPGFNPYYDTIFLPATTNGHPKRVPDSEPIQFLGILQASESAPRSLAVDTVVQFQADTISMLFKLDELFIVVGDGAQHRTKILETGLPFNLRDGPCDSWTERARNAKHRELTDFMERLQNATEPGTKMPVVKLTEMRRVVGVLKRAEFGDEFFLGFSVSFVMNQPRAMRGCLAP